MSDDKSNRGPADRSRIDLNEDYEVAYWTKELGVAKAKLEDAVRAVGSSAEKVREHLKAR
jgi:hypothetical protein